MPRLASRARSAPFALESRAAMDLLEYQGKQLFARHGIAGPVRQSRRRRSTRRSPPPTRSATRASSRRRCRSAGAARPAASRSPHDRTEAREHAGAILGMDIRGLTVHEVWIEAASEIASEYYASVVFDRSAKAPLVMLSTEGGMDIEEVAEQTTRSDRAAARRPAARLPGLPRPPARVRGGRRRRRRRGVGACSRALRRVRRRRRRRCSSRSTR